MLTQKALAQLRAEAQVTRPVEALAAIELETCYFVECFDHRGRLKWTNHGRNTVVNVGLDDVLNKYFKGSAYTAAWYVGLTDGTPTIDPTDTMASHVGWVEVHSTYSEANRPTLTLGTVASQSVDNSASKAAYTFTGSATVGGAFLVTNNTKNGSTGILYGAVAFTGADKSLGNGDTLNVTATLTTASA